MDNLESAIADIEEQVTELQRQRAALDGSLRELENRRRMLEGGPAPAHRHRCPHCGAYAVCPQAYGDYCPLEATTPADCRHDPYGGE